MGRLRPLSARGDVRPAPPAGAGAGRAWRQRGSGATGFGQFGTVGHHVFDENSAAWRRVAAVCALRQALPVLRHGRQYLRPLAIFGPPFGLPGPGELIAWSRLLDDEEALCVVNGHGTAARGGDVLVDATLNPAGSAVTVVLNTAQAGGSAAGPHPIGSSLPVQRAPDGAAFVAIRDLPPSEVLVLVNQP